jgi:hypothetical protein
VRLLLGLPPAAALSSPLAATGQDAGEDPQGNAATDEHQDGHGRAVLAAEPEGGFKQGVVDLECGLSPG